jgi:hypothetical protein
MQTIIYTIIYVIYICKALLLGLYMNIYNIYIMAPVVKSLLPQGLFGCCCSRYLSLPNGHLTRTLFIDPNLLGGGVCVRF